MKLTVSFPTTGFNSLLATGTHNVERLNKDKMIAWNDRLKVYIMEAMMINLKTWNRAL